MYKILIVLLQKYITNCIYTIIIIVYSLCVLQLARFSQPTKVIIKSIKYKTAVYYK